jgi:hypothetical protein
MGVSGALKGTRDKVLNEGGSREKRENFWNLKKVNKKGSELFLFYFVCQT